MLYSDGVALKAPIVTLGFFEHLPEGALPLAGLLEHKKVLLPSKESVSFQDAGVGAYQGPPKQVQV